MYRLLLIAQPTESTDPALWKAQNFDPVCICPDVCSALKLHEQKHFDAIGVSEPETYAETAELSEAAEELPQDADDAQNRLINEDGTEEENADANWL